MFKEADIYYEDTLNRGGCINELVYDVPSTSNQENRNNTLYGLSQHKVKLLQQE